MPASKKRRRDQPHKVLHLTTYQRLDQYLRPFAQGQVHVWIMLGNRGLAKSRSGSAVSTARPVGSRVTPPPRHVRETV